jgi:hypothetical protein
MFEPVRTFTDIPAAPSGSSANRVSRCRMTTTPTGHAFLYEPFACPVDGSTGRTP